jgi:hypothetical protein
MQPEPLEIRQGSTVFQSTLYELRSEPDGAGGFRLVFEEHRTIAATERAARGLISNQSNIVEEKKSVLPYTIIGPGAAEVTVGEHSVTFSDAGLRVETSPSGVVENSPLGDVEQVPRRFLEELLEAGRLSQVIQEASSVDPELIRRLGQLDQSVSRLNRLVPDRLFAGRVAWERFNLEPPELPEQIWEAKAESHQLRVTVTIENPSGVGTPLLSVIKSDERADGILVTDMSPNDEPVSYAAQLHPLLWMPVYDEAVAFGILTVGDNRTHPFARLGSLTGGYRATSPNHWIASLADADHLDYDVDADDPAAPRLKIGMGTKPSDASIALREGLIRYHAASVALFIGAMPLVDPTRIADVTQPDDLPFAYFTGTLTLPLQFDPIAACNGCRV